MKKAIPYLVLILLFLANTCQAQVGKETNFWQWTPKAPHLESVVRVETPAGNGSGVLFKVDKNQPVGDGYIAYIITAWHVVQDNLEDQNIGIEYQNGRRAKNCLVVAHSESYDTAIIKGWAYSGATVAKVAQKDAVPEDYVEYAGFGGNGDLDNKSKLRHFHCVSSAPTCQNCVFSNAPLVPGDSGGGVFNKNHELLGVISGGWFWFESDIKKFNDPQNPTIKITWPARCNNTFRTLELIGQIK